MGGAAELMCENIKQGGRAEKKIEKRCFNPLFEINEKKN